MYEKLQSWWKYTYDYMQTKSRIFYRHNYDTFTNWLCLSLKSPCDYFAGHSTKWNVTYIWMIVILNVIYQYFNVVQKILQITLSGDVNGY